VDEVIKDIRSICDANRCCILLFDKGNSSCSILCESIKPGADICSAHDLISEEFYEIASSWVDTLAGSASLILKDENDMAILKERNPRWLEHLKRSNVKSLVLIPLNFNGEILGYIWATNFETNNSLHIKETLELSSFFLASEIANYQLLKSLERMGSIDLLTGIKNRNIMNNRVDRIIQGIDSLNGPFAIIFADLNGLKRINDMEGHNAGDNMLKSAAAILQGVFYDCEVYRAGGDEFMIIATDLNQDEIYQRVTMLRTQSEGSKNVRFAVGISFGEKNSDIISAMRNADAKMYQDKNEYYLAHPRLKYR
jgi:diguanylate cyclase (GGDEF)-like protein